MATIPEKIVDIATSKPRADAVAHIEAIMDAYFRWLSDASVKAIESGDPRVDIAVLRDRLKEVDAQHLTSARQ